MNRKRRKALNTLINKLEKIDGKVDLQEYIDTLEEIEIDEEWDHDNTPDNLQSSVNYLKSEDAIYYMECAIDDLQDAQACENTEDFLFEIEDAIDCITTAIL